MSKVYFSIIIPTYNSVSLLRFAIQSILSQSFRDFEVCIVDGGSTDGIIDYIEQVRLQFSNIIFVSEKDNGIYDAMNKGIRLSNGKWLYFIGSDDTLYSDDVLYTVYNHIKNTADKVVYGNVLIKGNCGWATDRQVYDGEFDTKKLFKKNICHQAMFYERTIFEELGHFNPDYTVCADYDFNLRAAASYKLKYIDLQVAIFNAGGASTKVENKIVDAAFSLDKKTNICKYYKSKLFAPYMSFVVSSTFSYGAQIFRKGRYIEGLYFIIGGFYHKIMSKFH